MCKPGSVGDRGGRPPRSTRPTGHSLTPQGTDPTGHSLTPQGTCYNSDAPDEVVRRLTQVEQRPVPPELRMVSPELPGGDVTSLPDPQGSNPLGRPGPEPCWHQGQPIPYQRHA